MSRRQLTLIASMVSIPTCYRQCQTNNLTPRVSSFMFVINDLITIALNYDPTPRQNIKLFHCRHPIHARTVRRRIQEVGLRCYRPKKGCILTDRHKEARLNWAWAHLRWNHRQWRSVLFTDESKSNVQNRDGRTRMFRERSQRFSENCVQKRNRGGGGSVHL